MISSASSTADTLPAPPMVSSKPNSGNSSSDGETQPSFEDVLKQNGGGTADTTTQNRNAAPPVVTKASLNATSQTPEPGSATSLAFPEQPSPTEITNADSSAQAPSPAMTPGTTAAKSPLPVALLSGPDLNAMIVQASVLASNAPQSLAAKTMAVPAANVPGNSGSGTNPSSTSASETNMASLIAKASLLLSLSPQTTTGKTVSTSTAAAKSGTDSTPGGISAKNSAPVSNSTDLSTLIAQASILVSSAQQAAGGNAGSAAVTGKNNPLSGLTTGLSATTSKEKKSGSSSNEGSFLQSGTSASTDGSSGLGLLSSTLAGAGNLSLNQQLTSAAGSKNAAPSDPSISALSLAGTANVEKGKAMSTTLNFPQVDLLSGSGANTLTAQKGADLHIQLSSNQDFHDALKQVMHIAQLTQTNESRTPMRVAMEIQTPPGAIVNVYVSRQNDQWRAQLSTNDPQALSWVQDQMSSLRQSDDMGVNVRWLPPQIESGPTTTASTQDTNLGWDRGGQGQSNYQQPDDRQQSNRQRQSDMMPELAAVQSNPFMTTLTSLGRAA